jgi:hypothetical protein
MSGEVKSILCWEEKREKENAAQRSFKYKKGEAILIGQSYCMNLVAICLS